MASALAIAGCDAPRSAESADVSADVSSDADADDTSVEVDATADELPTDTTTAGTDAAPDDGDAAPGPYPGQLSLLAPLELQVSVSSTAVEGCDWHGDGLPDNALSIVATGSGEVVDVAGSLVTMVLKDRTIVWLPSKDPTATKAGQPLVVSWHEALLAIDNKRYLFASSLTDGPAGFTPKQTLDGTVTAEGFELVRPYNPSQPIVFWIDVESPVPEARVAPYWQEVRAIRAALFRGPDGTFVGRLCFAVETKLAGVYGLGAADVDTDGDGVAESHSAAVQVSLVPVTVDGFALGK